MDDFTTTISKDKNHIYFKDMPIEVEIGSTSNVEVSWDVVHRDKD
jgi:hypothetical protein